MPTFKKIGALWMSLSLVLALSFSYLFIAEELGHDCPGENCTACRQIDICLQTLSSYLFLPDTGDNPAVVKESTTYLPFTLVALSAPAPEHTLVTLGVKLSD